MRSSRWWFAVPWLNSLKSNRNHKRVNFVGFLIAMSNCGAF